MPSTECTTPSYNTDIAQQVATLRLSIAAYTNAVSPYLNTIEGGTFDNNSGEQIRTITPGRMVTNQSYAAPEFARWFGNCNAPGPTSRFGSYEYEAIPEVLTGKGPDICVTQARSTVLGMYSSAEKRLKEAITELKGADIANQYINLSGFKARLQAGATSVTSITNGGEYQVSVNFPTGLPDAGINWNVIQALDSYVRDNFEVETWGSGEGAYATFIGSSQAVEALRNDANINGDFSKSVQGSFKPEKDALFKRYFENVPTYRGLKFLVDRKNPRFNVVDGDGNPVLIEPYINVVADNGQVRQVNPEWVDARYEVGFLVYKNAFKYLVPKQYLGEGSFKFPAQMYAGDLTWLNILSDCNPLQQVGYHYYQIVRGFQPVSPHSVVPILIKRCAATGLGLIPCDTVS